MATIIPATTAIKTVLLLKRKFTSLFSPNYEVILVSFMLQIKTMNCGHIITAFVCPNANPKDKNKSYM